MHHFARRTAGFTALIGAASLIAAGCGDDDDKDANTASTVTTISVTMNKAQEPASGGAGEETKIATQRGDITVSGDIFDKYVHSGGPTGPLGVPIEAERDGPGDGEYQAFAGGAIYQADNGEAHIVWGEIRKAWEANGGPGGKLGYPISDEQDIPGGKQTDFTGGTITWVDGTITVTPKS